MPCLITAPMTSDIKQTTRQKTKISKNKNFTAKTENLNSKAHSKNVKMQSHKTLTTQNLLSPNCGRKVFLMRLHSKSIKTTINEAELINIF